MHLVMIGGSDAGISAALRARELDPGAEVTVVVADAYPNFSICGIPYYVSGEVTHWRNLAHRTIADLESDRDAAAAGHHRPPHRRRRPQAAGHRRRRQPRNCSATTSSSSAPARSRSGPRSAAWTARTRSARPTACTCCTRWATRSRVMRTLEQAAPASAVIVGAGYIGLEMADALTARGLRGHPDGAAARGAAHRRPRARRPGPRRAGRPRRRGPDRHHRPGDQPGRRRASRAGCGSRRSPPTATARDPAGRHGPGRRRRPARDQPSPPSAGAALGARGAIAVDRGMRTNLPDVFAAGDCVITHHRLLGETYLPLGTTAHKQGRVAGRERPRREPGVRRQPRHPGREDLRPGRRPHRAARPRSRTRPGSTRSPSSPRPTTTRPTTPAATASRCGSPATAPPAGCSACSCSATGTPRSPSASTSPPPRSSTA